jgi:hypothetical protein
MWIILVAIIVADMAIGGQMVNAQKEGKSSIPDVQRNVEVKEDESVASTKKDVTVSKPTISEESADETPADEKQVGESPMETIPTSTFRNAPKVLVTIWEGGNDGDADSESESETEDEGQEIATVTTEAVVVPERTAENEVKESMTYEKGEAALRELAASGRIGDITETSTTSERIWWIFDFLVSEGFTPEAAAGVIGNIAIECCFNPSTVSSNGMYGLFQWNTSSGGGYWWYDIENWLSENGYTWNSFEGQMKALLYCSNRGFLTDSRLEKLKGMTNVEEAVEYFAVFYEGCVGGSTPTVYYNVGTCYQGLDSRKSEAWVAYYMYVNGSTEYTGNKWYSY